MFFPLYISTAYIGMDTIQLSWFTNLLDIKSLLFDNYFDQSKEIYVDIISNNRLDMFCEQVYKPRFMHPNFKWYQ
jgi:hypothetical protein